MSFQDCAAGDYTGKVRQELIEEKGTPIEIGSSERKNGFYGFTGNNKVDSESICKEAAYRANN